MQKGKLGICLWVYPLLAFLLAIFGQPLMCLVLFLFALGAEKDEWAARQTLQAFLLALVSSLMDYVFGTAGRGHQHSVCRRRHRRLLRRD